MIRKKDLGGTQRQPLGEMRSKLIKARAGICRGAEEREVRFWKCFWDCEIKLEIMEMKGRKECLESGTSPFCSNLILTCS